MGSVLSLASPIASTSTSRRRLDRYADPDSHWLSEDEGTSVAVSSTLIAAGASYIADADRGHRTRRLDLGEGTSSRPPPSPPPDGSTDDKPGAQVDDGSKVIVHQALARISHRPFGRIETSPPPSTPMPRAETVVAALSRSLRCRACSAVFADPVTLDCGHSVCRGCLVVVPSPASAGSREPVAQPRSPPPPQPPPPLSAGMVRGESAGSRSPPTGGIFGRATASAVVPVKVTRRVLCPLVSCRGQPAVPEPRGDVALHKVLARLRTFAPRFDEPSASEMESDADAATVPTLPVFRPIIAIPPSRDASEDEAPVVPPRPPRLHRSRPSDDSHSSTADVADSTADGKRSRKIRSPSEELRRHRRPTRRHQDAAPGRTFVADVLSELECQVCVAPLFDPVTTPCGHSFCAKCLARSLDHSARCPLCRTDLPGFAFFHAHPLNLAVHAIMTEPFGAVYQERKAANERDERGLASMDTPIFVCTLAFPVRWRTQRSRLTVQTIVTFLRIFEPRYRLMMRRVMESESREFGMVMPGTAQGGMAEYGTMLRVVDLRLQDDGRSVVETVGTTRFRILEHGQLDGYTVGRVERVDDIPPDAEAALEAAAMARIGDGVTPELSTERLVAICHEFIELLRSGSAPWLVQRLNNTYGPPPTAVSDFSFWMAAVLPIDESEKVHLLKITSSRLRLRLLVHWITQMRSSWWFNGCSIS